MIGLAYRNDEDVLRARLDAALEEREGERAFVSARLRAVFARRAARAASGAIAVLGGGAMFVAALGRMAQGGGFSWGFSNPGDGLLAGLLGKSWLAAAIAYPVVRIGAGLFFDRALAKAPRRAESARIDLVRLERARPRRIAGDLLQGLEAPSASLPLAGLALIGPLGLHFALWTLCTAGDAIRRVEAFDGWISISIAAVGIAHVVLAVLGAQYGRLLAGAPDQIFLLSASDREGWKALGWTVLASLFPGALLILIPPLVVAFTGLAVVPLSFWWARHAIVSERAAMAAVLA